MVSSNAEMTQVLGSLMQSNNFTSDTTGMKLFGKTVYIDSSVFADFEDNNWFWAEDIYIMNSKFSRPGGRNYAKIWASQTNIRFNNVTFHIPRINKSLDIGQPTHLYAVDSKLYLANTVIDAYSPPDSTNHLPYVMLQTGATVWLDVNNFVGDGSLTGAASRNALLDSGPRPMSGSPPIDAGDDDHAINPLTNQELEHDLGGNPRISGVRVDICVYEAQQFFAINDAYSTQENTSLTVPARGVLLNDTYDAPGTLKGNAIKIFGGPQHGVIGVAGRNGGFIYSTSHK